MENRTRNNLHARLQSNKYHNLYNILLSSAINKEAGQLMPSTQALTHSHIFKAFISSKFYIIYHTLKQMF